MHVLLIEDHSQLAGLVSRDLRDNHGYEVSWYPDPIAARASYRHTRYDLAVIDLLYEDINNSFEARWAAGAVSLTAPQLLVTGLSAVHELAAGPNHTRTVIWTGGESNRRLHMLYAYEALHARVFCSKSSGKGSTETLVQALRSAALGRTDIDPVLNSYLPAPGAPTLAGTILRDRTKRSIWRALANRANSRDEISTMTGYTKRTIGNLIPDMLDDASRLDPGIRPTSAPMNEISTYARKNWQFFLDDHVRTEYP
jgi:DNA-binding NarL/FixJ family response regulator